MSNYPPYAPKPGVPPQYAPQYTDYASGPSQPFYNDTKSPYENDRFKPRRRINDPIVLILFILQVSLPLTEACCSSRCYVVSWLCRAVRYSARFMGQGWWARWWIGQRFNWHACFPQPEHCVSAPAGDRCRSASVCRLPHGLSCISSACLARLIWRE